MYAVFYDDLNERKGFECEEGYLVNRLIELGYVEKNFTRDRVMLNFLDEQMIYDNVEIYEVAPQSLIKRNIDGFEYNL